MQQVVKYSSLSPYMLKHPSLLSQGFNKNKEAQGKLFKNMCNFGAQEECSNGRRAVSYYLDVETRRYQYRVLNPTPLDCILGYII